MKKHNCGNGYYGQVVKSHGIDIAQGHGELIGPGRLKVNLNDGHNKEYRARKIILASGSKPATLPFVDVDGHYVQTTDDALDSEDIPENILIIGGGVIGMEMATIYLNLGRKVTILELLPDILMTEYTGSRKTHY